MGERVDPVFEAERERVQRLRLGMLRDLQPLELATNSDPLAPLVAREQASFYEDANLAELRDSFALAARVQETARDPERREDTVPLLRELMRVAARATSR